ncbi:MAG: NADH-quinone oxidoreductase subunit M [Candidatus Abyssobacteria bacterium SURF_17]|uniref:NADH-quinone oxidoreductase subunit M n=1 Tax=Candidatus Abyssobacteria bacterium SURF_17 TaxID=2093361 RepID=A0A419EPF4_9BACT|nr:MAG: NADH-quinone oxidoreductase subunit M [Candidatus Abyssubacteria bacterium SURF_17]
MGLKWPLLSIITYIPVLGAIVIMLFMRRDATVKWFANIVVLVDFLISLRLVFTPQLKAAFVTGKHVIQFVEKVPWIESLGVQYFFGVDGISILLVLLTTFLGVLAVLSSWSAITERVKEYYVFMLLLQTGMLGVFFSLDFFLFYVFWEIMLVPMYFLIGVWGGPRKLYAAIKFFLYTLAGSVLMLLAILGLYFLNYRATGNLSFEIMNFYNLDIPLDIAKWLFLAFFVGFAIKVPMFPFHTWLPDAHVEAPTAGSVILAGVLLKMGTYGFVRFSLPLFPEATRWFLPYGIALAVIGIVYGALTAMMQPDMKKLVAYSSVSHLGFVMLGVFALNQQGVQGGILQMINHGLSTGALFLVVGLVYERRHTRMIADFGGLSKQMPVYAILFMIVTLSSIGLPGLNGFIGEFTILIGAFKALWMKPVVALRFLPADWAAGMSTLMVLLAASGIVLGAAYMLWLYQRVMFGKLENPKNMDLKDLNLREVMTLIPIVFFCFWIGLYPKPFLKLMDAAVANTVLITNPEAALAEMQQMQTNAAREHKMVLPPGHPPLLPPGHPEIIPPGHPSEQGAAMGHGAEKPGSVHGSMHPPLHPDMSMHPEIPAQALQGSQSHEGE